MLGLWKRIPSGDMVLAFVRNLHLPYVISGKKCRYVNGMFEKQIFASLENYFDSPEVSEPLYHAQVNC